MSDSKQEVGVSLVEYRETLQDETMLFKPTVELFVQVANLMREMQKQEIPFGDLDLSNWFVSLPNTVRKADKPVVNTPDKKAKPPAEQLALMMYFFIKNKAYDGNASNLNFDLSPTLWGQTGFSTEGMELYAFINGILTNPNSTTLQDALERMQAFKETIEAKERNQVLHKQYKKALELLSDTKLPEIELNLDARVIEGMNKNLLKSIVNHNTFQQAQKSYDRLVFLMESLGKESVGARRPNISLIVEKKYVAELGEITKSNKAIFSENLGGIVHTYAENYQLVIAKVKKSLADTTGLRQVNRKRLQTYAEKFAFLHKYYSDKPDKLETLYEHYKSFADCIGIKIVDADGEKTVTYMEPDLERLEKELGPVISQDLERLYSDNYYQLRETIDKRAGTQKELCSKAANILHFLPHPVTRPSQYVTDIHHYIEAMVACNEVMLAIQNNGEAPQKLKNNKNFQANITTLVEFHQIFDNHNHESKHPKRDKLVKAFLGFAAVALVIVGILALIPTGGTSVLASVLGASLLAAKSAGTVAGVAAIGTGVTAATMRPQTLNQSVAAFKSHMSKIGVIEENTTNKPVKK